MSEKILSKTTLTFEIVALEKEGRKELRRRLRILEASSNMPVTLVSESDDLIPRNPGNMIFSAISLNRLIKNEESK